MPGVVSVSGGKAVLIPDDWIPSYIRTTSYVIVDMSTVRSLIFTVPRVSSNKLYIRNSVRSKHS